MPQFLEVSQSVQLFLQERWRQSGQLGIISRSQNEKTFQRSGPRQHDVARKPVGVRVHRRRSLHVGDDGVERSTLRSVHDDGVGGQDLESSAANAECFLLPGCCEVLVRRIALFSAPEEQEICFRDKMSKKAFCGQ